MRITPRLAAAATAGAVGAALVLSSGASARQPDAGRQAAFTAAAHEFGVPESVLLAVSYNETLWEAHHGLASSNGAYGPMALTDVSRTRLAAGSGKGRDDGTATPAADSPALHTLTTAAGLLHVPPDTVRTDDTTNIRAGAALLASYAKTLGNGHRPTAVGDWYGAVARYSEAASSDGATMFATDVYATIKAGASRRTDDGQQIRLSAQPDVRANTATMAPLKLSPPTGNGPRPECPPGLNCNFIPAAYQQTDPKDKGVYGNYDLANRPADGFGVHYIVIHDTEETYDQAVQGFQNPAREVSAHYVVDGTRGLVTQMVPTRDVAWHAGNWYINGDSVGIEQQGWITQSPTWFTEKLYRTTAALVRYLAARYHIPLDRQHIIGHDNVPATSPTGIPAMHWDPGPYWDWNHFMNLLGTYTVPTGGPNSKIVTINPSFRNTPQATRDCEQGRDLPAWQSSFVWLRTGPSADSPLFTDPGLHRDGKPGDNCAADWGDKASTGQQFAVAQRQGDWVAVWYAGAKVWFQNPRQHRTATPTSGFVVRPRAGQASVPVYGVAYPEASAYPKDIPVQKVTPLPYTIQAGQSYVYGGPTPANYYYAPTIDSSLPGDHTNVVGRDRYYVIQINHRIGFVKASDVDVVPAFG